MKTRFPEKMDEKSLSVNTIQLSKKLNLAARNRMLIGSNAESNNMYFSLNKGEVSILKDEKGRIHKERE